MKLRHLGTLVVIGALALGACGSSGGSKSEPTKTATGGAITVGAYDTPRFDVGVIDATAGPLSVTLVNHGAVEHTFEIKGTSMLLKADGGKSSTGTVTLEKGTYDFQCTIPGHAQAGMKGTVVVS
jgi:plastocyanin